MIRCLAQLVGTKQREWQWAKPWLLAGDAWFHKLHDRIQYGRCGYVNKSCLTEGNQFTKLT